MICLSLAPRATLAAVCIGALAARVNAAPVDNLPAGFAVEEFASGFAISTSLDWLPDGRIIISEVARNNNTGQLLVINTDGSLEPTPLYSTPVTGGNGLSGLTLHPDFETNPSAYVWVAEPGNVEHELRRLTIDTQSLTVSEEEVVITVTNPVPETFSHGQTNMDFGPDGRLYVNLGDSDSEIANDPPDPALAQRLDNLWGKVFVLDVDQPLPIDVGEPWEHILTYGHRNQFGMAIHPVTGTVWVTENGAASTDELNLIRPGANYGWPYVEGASDLPVFEAPVFTYSPPIAPVDAVFYTGMLYPQEYRDDLYFADFNTGAFRRVFIEGSLQSEATGQEVWFEDHLHGFISALALGPDDMIYFASMPIPFSTSPNNILYRISYTPPPLSGVTTR